jgi:hypothetical protein
MSALGGVLALLVGLAFLLLTALAAAELIRFRARRGFSQFGTAFVLTALLFGAHAIAAGMQALVRGDAVSPLVTASLLLGLAPAAGLALLRLESAAGGRGERFVAGTPWWLRVLPWAAMFAAGMLAAGALDHAGEHGIALWMTWPSLVIVLLSASLGWLFARAQAAARLTTGGWSLSGLALAALFPAAAAVQATTAATGAIGAGIFLIDVAAVPPAGWFLLTTIRLQRSALRDWNRRPLVGRPRPTGRPSPWASRA